MRTIRRQAKATSLDHAIELAKRHAKEQHRPSKVMADLMGVELKTYYRWLLDNTLPLNRIAQFEALTGSRFISEYLSVLHGDRVVIEIPRGRKGKAADKQQLAAEMPHQAGTNGYTKLPNAKRHRAAMLKAEHPLKYDYSDGWTANFDEQPATELEEAQA